MKLHFSEISSSPSRLTLTEGEWTELEEGRVTAPHAELELCRQDQDTVIVGGKVQATLRSFCARCSEPTTQQLASSFRYVATTEQERVEEQEIECLEEDIVRLHLKEPQLDLTEMLREQLILAQPLRLLCSEACLGLCPECGSNRNRKECNCAETNGNSPFAVLHSLKKNSET